MLLFMQLKRVMQKPSTTILERQLTGTLWTKHNETHTLVYRVCFHRFVLLGGLTMTQHEKDWIAEIIDSLIMAAYDDGLHHVVERAIQELRDLLAEQKQWYPLSSAMESPPSWSSIWHTVTASSGPAGRLRQAQDQRSVQRSTKPPGRPSRA